MKTSSPGTLVGVGVAAVGGRARAAGRHRAGRSSPDEAAIRANCDKYVESYNRRDSRTMAAMWSPDAVYMDPTTDERFVGRDDIAKFFDDVFAGMEDAELAVTIDSIDFVSPNVAIEKGTAVVSYSRLPAGGNDLLGRAREARRQVVSRPRHRRRSCRRRRRRTTKSSRSSNGWSARGSTPTTTPRSRREIEWTKNRNFLRRSFAVVIGDQIDMSGMQIIGWDPAEKQIRSWVFDSEGGFSEATWTHKDDQWFIQNNGTLADGRKATLAQHSHVRRRRLVHAGRSVNREVDGELLPNVDEVTRRACAGGRRKRRRRRSGASSAADRSTACSRSNLSLAYLKVLR